MGLVSEWRVTTLDQLGRIVTGKTPHSRHPENFGGEIPFVTPTDLTGRRRIESTERHLTEQGAMAVCSARIPSEAIMVSCIGSDMGKSAIAAKACVTNQQINSIIVESADNPLFVYYNLSRRKEEIRATASGSAQPILNKSAFGQLDIVLPPPPEQRAIAHVLGTLDDKIELNRHMNETLEAMARALFKSWFIDFDPVRAKMTGRDPGLPEHLANLFPDRLVDSELGPIPKGWEISTIGQEVDVVGGSTPSTKDPAFWNGTINWATPKDLSSLESPVLVETSRKITEKGLDNIGSGLLPRGTVLLSSRAPIGYLAISDVPVAINQGFIAMKCQKRLSNTYVWLWTAANMAAILENANGSTFQEISKSNFRPLSVIVPNVSVRKTYDKLMQRLYDRIVKNERQSCSLAALRDALLPKLISGELRTSNLFTGIIQ